MRQPVSRGALVACALMLGACGGGTRTDQAGDNKGAGDNPFLGSDVRPQPITATGCLTASDGRFVLTTLDDTAAVPTTVTYQLSGGNEADLQKQVNREVRVAGEAEPAKIADVRDVGAPAVGTSGNTSGTSGQPEPRVKTQEAVRFEVRTLKVSSVTATGDECPAGHPDEGRPK